MFLLFRLRDSPVRWGHGVHSCGCPSPGAKLAQLHQSGRGFRVPREHQPLSLLDPRVPSSHRVAHKPRRQTADQIHPFPRHEKRVCGLEKVPKRNVLLCFWIETCWKSNHQKLKCKRNFEAKIIGNFPDQSEENWSHSFERKFYHLKYFMSLAVIWYNNADITI